MAMTLAYLPLSPEVHPVQTKYTAPLSTAIQIPYKRKPETLSEQVVRLMDSRPRDQVVICNAKPERHRHSYDDELYPTCLSHVSGKRSLSRRQVARLENRFYNPEPPYVINNRAHSQYIYEHEGRLPPRVNMEPKLCRTVSVSPGPEYAPLPHSRNHYSRPRVYLSGDGNSPCVMEIRQRR